MQRKVALITNMPAPYRETIHEILSTRFNDYLVIYCSKIEADRDWKFNFGNYKKVFLNNISSNSTHNNINILKYLYEYQPNVIVIMGFYPTMLYAWLWSLIKNCKLIVFTDGTIDSESHLSFLHRLIRKIVFLKTSAFIGPALKSEKLYKSYGFDKNLFFRTYLCVDNSKFFKDSQRPKQYDLMYSGQFIDRKMPLFFIEVANYIKNKVGKCSVLLIGSGNLKDEILSLLNKYSIDYCYPGYIQQKELPKYYSLAKVFLFPTKNDPWGVVANEAMASGVPVITCNNAGVAGDLVIHEKNGLILPLDVKIWGDKIINLLTNNDYYNMLSQNSILDVQRFNFENAAQGIQNAIESV